MVKERTVPAPTPGWRGFLSPLGNRDFRRLWLANGLWWHCVFMELVIFGWLALTLTDSAWWVSLLGFFRSRPDPPPPELTAPRPVA